MLRLLFAFLLLVTAARGQELAGVWIGDLERGGVHGHVVLALEKTPDGLSGAFIGADLGTEMPLTFLNREGSNVRFEVGRAGGIFTGAFTSDGDALEGAWTQPGFEQSLRLERSKLRSLSCLACATLEITVHSPPIPFPAAGRSCLAYELQVTNWMGGEITLQRVEVLVGDNTVAIEGDTLRSLILSKDDVLGPGQQAIVWLFLSSDSRQTTLRHRVTAKRTEGAETIVEEGALVNVGGEPITIAPPVRGSGWRMGAGPANAHHRSSMMTASGRMTFAQRFAFDFIKEDAASGAPFVGDDRLNESYPAYGAEALAVADATVLSVVDGLSDNTPFDLLPASPITRASLLGNSVVLDLGGNRLAVYAHLQPGSLRVSQGDKVRRGDVVGLIGNSGRSGGPHLHFHVVAGSDPLDAEGVPFVFDSFRREGLVYKNEMPLDDWLVDFND